MSLPHWPIKTVRPHGSEERVGSDFWLCRLLFLHGQEARGSLHGGEAHLGREAPDVHLLHGIGVVDRGLGDPVPLVADGRHSVREHEVGVPLAFLVARGAVAVGGECRLHRPRAPVVVLEHHCSQDHRVLGVSAPVERLLGDAEGAGGLGDVHVVREGDVHHVAGAVLGLGTARALVAGDAGEEGGGDLGELFAALECAGEELEAVGPEGRTAVAENLLVRCPHFTEKRGADGLASVEGVLVGFLLGRGVDLRSGVSLPLEVGGDHHHEGEDRDHERPGTGNAVGHGQLLALAGMGGSAGRYLIPGA